MYDCSQTALNEALKKEVERLKIATGEIMTHNDTTYNLGMHHVSYPSSSFFSHQPQPQPGDPQNVQMPSPFHQFQSNTSTAHQPLLAAAHSHAFTDMLQQDPLGRLQGLDISGRGSHMVKPEGTSISVSESSNSFWCKFCQPPRGRICWIVHRLTYWQPKVLFIWI